MNRLILKPVIIIPPRAITRPHDITIFCTQRQNQITSFRVEIFSVTGRYIGYDVVEICWLWQKSTSKDILQTSSVKQRSAPVSSLQKQNGLWYSHWSYHSLLLKGLFVRHLLNEKVNKTFYKSSHKRKIQFIHGIPGGMVVGIPVKCGISYHHGFVSFVPEGSMVA